VLYLVGIIGLLCIGVLNLFLFRVKPQIKRLQEESKKLQLKINQVRAEVGSGEGSNLIKSALGEVGLDGIMDELGIDPGILKSPIVRGLIDRYAPKIIEQITKKEGAENGTQNKGFGFM
jgi:hypothetical protein